MFEESLKRTTHNKIAMLERQCYIPPIISIKINKEFMGYPKKHRGRRKQGSKKRRAKRKNKKK